jgi:hypothetical protein
MPMSLPEQKRKEHVKETTMTQLPIVQPGRNKTVQDN